MIQDTLTLQINLLRFVGISLKEKERVWYKIYALAVLSTITSLPLLTGHAVVTNMNRYGTLIENITYNVAFSAVYIKVLTTLAVRQRLSKTLKILQNGIFASDMENDGQGEDLIKTYVVYAKWQSVVLSVMSGIYAGSASVDIIIQRIIQGNPNYWRLPFGDFCLFDVTSNPSFNIVWAYQTVAVFMACMAYCMTEAFIAAIMAQLSCRCKILQELIKASVERTHNKMMENSNLKGLISKRHEATKIEWKYLKRTLKEIVQYHIALTDVTEKFESLFYIEMLVNFIGLAFTICLAMLYFTTMGEFNFRSLQPLTLASGSAILQFMTSYWGSEVTLENFAIGDACYNVDYVGVDVRFQKALSFIIQRTQKPVQFTVGKFVPLTLNVFFVAMKAAYSYYMLLKKVNRKAV